jgi:hypothetical protein
LKIIITEINTKNSIALQRELSQYDDVHLIGYSSDKPIIAKPYGFCKEYCSGEFVDVVIEHKPDFIIPVGGPSVTICSEHFRNISLLATRENLDIAFNKDRLVELNSIQGVNYPDVNTFKSTSELMSFCAEGSIVVKSNNEAKSKFDPLYIDPDFSEEHNNFKVIDDLLKSGVELLAQRKVQGVGRGFFCIANNGKIYTYYMHERIREFPVTGGSSTAAKSIYCPILHSISEDIVKHLNWSGPLMIEFKFDKSSYTYYLIELNPKFWGSLDLSYAVGLTFGRTLIDVYRGRISDVNHVNYQVGIKFYWILDGDILNLIQTRNLKGIGQYFKTKARTSLFENIFVDFIKIVWNIKKLFKI